MSGPSSNKKVSQHEPKQDLQIGATYKKGDFIGQKYEVYGILGKGGCGIVYQVYSHETGEVYALKTVRDEFLADQEVRKRFNKEASVWVELGHHPYLVRALMVENEGGRLYIVMEYISPNDEGLSSLEGYLQRQYPDLAQSLRWAIQVCHGMEYAYSKGLRAHRDLKPANIMITQDKTARITDFGLAGVVSESLAIDTMGWEVKPGRIGFSGQTNPGAGFGTPTHMSPEQFDNAKGCDERSDIYSFGIVLYQMVEGGHVPFLAPLPRDDSIQARGAFWQAMHKLHSESSIPRLVSPLFPIIQHCLDKTPDKRYQTFKDIRKDLEPLLQHQTGELINPPQLKELEAWEWSNKGSSLHGLGRHEEAIRCFDKALKLNPRLVNVWCNKGAGLKNLERLEESICCLNKALELDPNLVNGWYNKGNSLHSLGRYEESIRCFDKALELDPCYVAAWYNKGACLDSLGNHEEAIRCYDQALELDPGLVNAWFNKGGSLNSLGRYQDAIRYFDQALKLDPHYVAAWNNRGYSLGSQGFFEEAIRCYDKALVLDPCDINAWYNKGVSLNSLSHYEKAINCLDKALEINPRHLNAWINKALAEDQLGHLRDAANSYQQYLALAPAQYAEQTEYARQRLREMGGK